MFQPLRSKPIVREVGRWSGIGQASGQRADTRQVSRWAGGQQSDIFPLIGGVGGYRIAECSCVIAVCRFWNTFVSTGISHVIFL